MVKTPTDLKVDRREKEKCRVGREVASEDLFKRFPYSECNRWWARSSGGLTKKSETPPTSRSCKPEGFLPALLTDLLSECHSRPCNRVEKADHTPTAGTASPRSYPPQPQLVPTHRGGKARGYLPLEESRGIGGIRENRLEQLVAGLMHRFVRHIRRSIVR